MSVIDISAVRDEIVIGMTRLAAGKGDGSFIVRIVLVGAGRPVLDAQLNADEVLAEGGARCTGTRRGPRR